MSKDTASSTNTHSVPAQTVEPDHSEFFPQLWFLLITLMIFGAYVAWDLRLFSQIVTLDASYMASVIMVLVVAMSVHCGWHILHTFQHTRSARHWLIESRWQDTYDDESDFVQRYINDVTVEQYSGSDGSEALLEIHADRIRSPAELGWFFVDLTVRLGLLGTIIGFILIFATLDNISIEGGDDLKNLLVAMSGGMGTALYTTLTGLIGASLLSFQYLVLGRQAEYLLGLMLRIRQRIRRLSVSNTP